MAIGTMEKVARGASRLSWSFKRSVSSEVLSWREQWFDLLFEPKISRKVQIAVKLVFLLGMIVTIMRLTSDYNDSPTVTTMESDSYPARDVDFPAIAVCPTNKMSLQAVNELAEEIHSFETTKIFNLSFYEVRDMLKYLGHLYVFDVDENEIEEAQHLHAILTRAYGDYNVDQIMMQLTPKCRSILKFCAWEGKDRVCDNMFFLRRTQDGYCCTFNYARRNDGFGNTKRSGFVSSLVERSTLINPAYGLTVILNCRSDDYFYKSAPSNGYKMLLFTSQDYPDAPSGSLNEVWIPPKSEVFVSMDALSTYSVPEVMGYDVSARNCLFNTEQDKIFQGYYSYSDCIMYCRIRDILRLCKCIPFFYPRPADIDSPKSCNLDDLLCLREFVVKWRQVRPRLQKKSTFDDSDIAKNPSSHLNCECFPTCVDVNYKITTSKIPLTRNKILWERNIVLNRNYSLMHVFFDGPNTIRLKQDVLYYWYELMSDYGGACSLFLGLSIINVMEILYVGVNLLFNRGARGTSSNNRETVDQPDNGTMQDVDHSVEKKSGLMKEETARLNAVKVIDVPLQPRAVSDRAMQLYWQEFVKPMSKAPFKN